MFVTKRLIILIALAVAAGSLVSISTPTTASASSIGCQFRGAVKPRPVKSTPYSYRHAKQWVYGDSITWQTYRNLGKTLKGRQAVDAYWGRNTTNGVDALRRDYLRYREHLPKAVVMATGTNDLQDMVTFRREVVRARAMLPKRVKLVWVNTYVDTSPNFNEANRVLRSVPGVKVVSWSGVNVGHRVDGRSTLLYDGVHVTRLGCVLRNQAIKRALR